jgi:hypothetical protein
VDALVAGGACLDRLHLREEGLLRQVALVDLADLLVGNRNRTGVNSTIRAAARYGWTGFSLRSCMSRKAQ